MEFAKSLSGHDKNQYYLVLKKDDEFVYLVNGKTKPLEKPKKKNLKHIQIIKRLPEEVKEMLEDKLTDITINKAIKTYERSVKADNACES